MAGNSQNLYRVASGYRLVDGSSQTVALKFYTLKFSETGLPLSPTEYSWSVTVSNNTGFYIRTGIQDSSLSLFVLGGNYTYTILYGSAKARVIGALSFLVKAGFMNTTESTAVSLVFENVTFSEKGMPAGAQWAVAAFNSTTSAGDLFVSGQSTGNLYLLSGIYQYVSYRLTDRRP